MAEGIALLAAYGDDEMEEEEEHEAAKPLPGSFGKVKEGLLENGDQGKEEATGSPVGVPNGSPKPAASDWKIHSLEQRSPKMFKASPVGSRAGSRSPLDVGRLGRSPLGQSMGAAEDTQGGRSEPGEVSGREDAVEEDLSDFLPPPPEEKCSEELQQKFAKWVELLKQGKSYNDAMRKSKPYKNPDFLAKVVAYQGIDEIGSCFAKDVWDPHGLPQEDFYDNLATAQWQKAEQREQEKRKLGKVDFVKGGVQATGLNLPGPDGRPIQVATSQKVVTPPLPKGPSIPLAAMAAAKVTDIRPGKRTKWDKVDDRGGLPPLDAVAVARERAAAIGGGSRSSCKP